MPSLQDFLGQNYQRLLRVRLGIGLRNQCNLFIVTLLESAPNMFRRRFPYVDNKLNNLKERMSGSMMIHVGGVIYAVRNFEDLTVLNPDFEPFMNSWFRPKRGDVFVDIGSHVGKYAVQTAKIVGAEGLVVALEPHPETFKALLNNIELNHLQNIIACNIAAWNHSGKLTFHFGGSASEFSAHGDSGGRCTEVETKAVDELLIHDLKLRRVDWIKIDVEKAETEVLEGLETALKKLGPKLFIEVWNKNMTSVEALLAKNDYNTTVISKSFGSPSESCVYLYCEPLQK